MSNENENLSFRLSQFHQLHVTPGSGSDCHYTSFYGNRACTEVVGLGSKQYPKFHQIRFEVEFSIFQFPGNIFDKDLESFISLDEL